MSEPEDILLDGAHHATRFVQGLWRRRAANVPPDRIDLVDVRARLEHFVLATFGVPVTIAVAEPPALPNWFERMGRRIPRHLVERRTLASTDGARICLPRSLPAASADGGGLAMYRLLAAGLACRLVRGSARSLPGERLVRDLFLLREAQSVAGMLAAELPGLLHELRAAHVRERTRRPVVSLLTAPEAAVEAEVMAALELDPASSDNRDVAASLTWAHERAATLRQLPGQYRGLPPVELWGLLEPLPSAPGMDAEHSASEEEEAAPWRVTRMQRRPKVRQAVEDEDDDHVGLWMIQLDDPKEHVEDPMGLQRPTDRSKDADPADLADSLSELPEARLVTTPGRAREVLASDDPPPLRSSVVKPGARQPGFMYPEWDYRSCAYVERGAIVRERTAMLGSAQWAKAVLIRRASLLAEVRRRFERLRPRRQRVNRQLDGPEVDLAAFVSSHADRQAGIGADNRLYETVIPARRDVAITLLVDVSGSTDSWIMNDLRVVDVEKEALLVVCDALEALGDPYAILAFSGEGPECVSMQRIKSFNERSGGIVQRRIAALEPDRYTRMGAAVRHATALLCQQAAAHRLLLVLSDGKPNDVDLYEGRYGVEDSRQAVAEARLQGLHPFCVTVDRQAPSYMPRIFGAGGYATLQHPEHLPAVLVEVLRRLIRR